MIIIMALMAPNVLCVTITMAIEVLMVPNVLDCDIDCPKSGFGPGGDDGAGDCGATERFSLFIPFLLAIAPRSDTRSKRLAIGGIICSQGDSIGDVNEACGVEGDFAATCAESTGSTTGASVAAALAPHRHATIPKPQPEAQRSWARAPSLPTPCTLRGERSRNAEHRHRAFKHNTLVGNSSPSGEPRSAKDATSDAFAP